MSKFKIIFLCGFLTAVTCISGFCQEGVDAKNIFYQAGQLYREGKFDEAVAEYEKLLSGDTESANIYYNIGNCYFKKGAIGKAIVNYQRAKRLNPRDRDMEANLRHALSMTKSTSGSDEGPWFLRYASDFFDTFTINELAVILSSIYLIIIILILICFIFKIPKFHCAIVSFILGIILVFSSVGLYLKISDLKREAVIIEEKTDARFEPFDRATTHFVLYEGNKVLVIKRNDGWDKVRRRDGKVGWVENKSLELI